MTDSRGNQGPTNDPVVRATIQTHLDVSIEWMMATMGWPFVPAGPARPVPARLPMVRTTREVDLLTWIGPDRLLHVEYETAPRRDLWPRMLEYRHLIMKEYQNADLAQIVLVLGDGPVIARDEPRAGGFRLGASVIRMAEQDPEDLLSRPGLEPLAVLTRSAEQDPETIYRRALASIRQRGEDQDKSVIALMTLAHGILTVPTMERFQEEGMFTYDEIRQQMYEAPIAGQLMREAEERGEEHGREEGREEIFDAMLEAKFGEHEEIPAIARALAALPRAQASRVVMAAGSIGELREL